MKIQIPITEDEAQDLLDGTNTIKLTPPELPDVEIELVSYDSWSAEGGGLGRLSVNCYENN